MKIKDKQSLSVFGIQVITLDSIPKDEVLIVNGVDSNKALIVKNIGPNLKPTQAFKGILNGAKINLYSNGCPMLEEEK